MQQFDSHKEKSAVEELTETGHEFRDLWRFDLESGAWDSLKVSKARVREEVRVRVRARVG